MYNKLFTKILDSSIWLESDTTRIVWLTCIAAMDEDGFVQFASPANLAHRANVPLDATITALNLLEGPDANSSDPDHEGRRLERVDGGWLVLNAEKYRALATRAVRQEQIRKRVASFRARKRTGVDEKLDQQQRKCACCGQPFEEPFSSYVVQDHDHVTGLIRGLICQSCNKVVGLVESGKSTLSTKVETCRSYLSRYGNASVTLEKPNGNAPVTPSEAEARSEKNQKKKHATHVVGSDKPADPRVKEFLTWFQAEYKRQRADADYFVTWPKHSAIVKQLLGATSLDKLKIYAQVMLSEDCEDAFIEESDRGIEILRAKFNWLSERVAVWQRNHRR